MTQDALFASDNPRPSATSFNLGATRRKHPPKPPHPCPHVASKHPDGVRATWCRTCRQPILTGLDNLTCAFPARVDPTPLTALGEALALLGGQRTYELRAGRPTRLVRRNATLIAARPAGAPRTGPAAAYDVVAEHRCGPPPAGPSAAPTALPPPAARTTDPTAQPPF